MTDLYDYSDINEKTKQCVIDNFNEDPLNVNEYIESLRRWIQSMPHLKCPTDCKYLLRFLRMAKFDLARAKQLLDNSCTIRSSRRGSQQFFNRKMIDDALIEEFLDAQMLTLLGSNEDGELLVLFKMNNWDPDKISREQWSLLVFMSHDVVMAQHAEIYGVRFFVDLSGTSRKIAKQWGDGDYVKNMTTVIQDAYPWKNKGVIFYGSPKVFDPFYKMWGFYKNGEADNSFIQIKKDEQHKIDDIPGLRNLLPTECGGLGGPLIPIAERWKQQFKSYYANGDPIGCDLIDESKRDPETSDYFNEYPDYHGPCYDTECSDG